MNNHHIHETADPLKIELLKRWGKFKVGQSDTEFRLPFLPSPLELLVVSKICTSCQLHFFKPIEKTTGSTSDTTGVYLSLNLLPEQR